MKKGKQMFIVDTIKKEQAQGELKLLYKMIEKNMGFVPAHFELFASIDLEAMKEFLEYNMKFLSHESIDATLLPYLRLEIAQRESREYCINFNTSILKSKGVTDLNNPQTEKKQILLMQKVLKAIYNSKDFSKIDLNELEEVGLAHKDFLDLLSYATNFMAKSKMIEVYRK